MYISIQNFSVLLDKSEKCKVYKSKNKYYGVPYNNPLLHKKMKSAINKELEEVQASEYNPRQRCLEDLFCPVCREQVIFVRASSGAKNRPAHFKHVSGENSQKCELYNPYSGSYNTAVVRKVQSISERLAMLVNVRGNFFQFYIGMTFSEEELSSYEAENTELKIAYWAGGLLKNETRLINRAQFSAHQREKFPLEVGCKEVSVSINNKGKVIPCVDGITYYRIIETESDDTSIWARKIEKNSLMQSLYVGEQYVLIAPKYTVLRDMYKISKQINTVSTFDLYFVEIKEYSDKSVEVCRQQGYNLKDIREQFDILWPPVKINNGSFEVNSNELLALSNMELAYGQNISCDNFVFEEGVYRIVLDRDLIVRGELKEYSYMLTEPRKLLCKAPRVETVICREIIADNDQFYLFNSRGVQKLDVGQKVRLLSNNFVQQNHKNYPLRRYRCKREKIKYIDWVSEALKYYKTTERFDAEEVVYKGNNPYVWQYLRKAKNSGLINSYIKRRITENTDD